MRFQEGLAPTDLAYFGTGLMDHSKQRPGLPGSTPAPAPTGTSSVYQSTSFPRFEDSFLQEMRVKEEQAAMSEGQLLQTGNVSLSNFQASQQRKSQMKAINKMIRDLPYNMRERVESMFVMALNTAESASKQLEMSHRESATLKLQLRKKFEEIGHCGKTIDMYVIVRGLICHIYV